MRRINAAKKLTGCLCRGALVFRKDAAFSHAVKDAVPDDDVIEEAHAHHARELKDHVCHVNILFTRRGVPAGMVVHENESRRVLPDRVPEDLARGYERPVRSSHTEQDFADQGEPVCEEKEKKFFLSFLFLLPFFMVSINLFNVSSYL